MLTFAAVATTALSPAVTLPVIAGLILVLALTITYGKKKRVQFGELLASFVKVAERDTERRVNEAVELTYDMLKGFSLDELKDALHSDARLTTLDEELKVRDHERSMKRMSQEGVGDGGMTFKSVLEKQRALGIDPHPEYMNPRAG